MGWQDAPLATSGPAPAPAATGWQSAPLADGAAPAEQGPLSWSDVPMQALLNTPASAVNFASDIVQPVLHPIDTATSIKNLGMGALQKAGLISGTEGVETADAVWKYFSDRYGTAEGFKQALAKDPVGVLGDLSTAITVGGAGAAKLPGTLGRIGKTAATVGKTIDPLTVLPNTAAKAFEWGTGVTSGAGMQAVGAARTAGREGGAASEALTSHMRGTANMEEIVTDARSAAEAMKKAAQTRYVDQMKQFGVHYMPLQFDDIDKALKRVDDIVYFHGRPRQELLPIRNQLRDLVEEWKGLPNVFQTPLGFDELKKVIWEDVRSKIPVENKAARTIARDVYDAVKGTIVRQDSNYAKVMADYEKYAKLLQEIEDTLSLNPNARVDTTLRKLTSSIRSNVNTNYGRRVDLVKQLERAGADQLSNKIAGTALNTWAPRGFGNVTGGSASLYALGNLLTGGVGTLATGIPMVAATSPRLAGEVAHGYGVAERYAGKVKPLFEPLRNLGRLSNIQQGGR